LIAPEIWDKFPRGKSDVFEGFEEIVRETYQSALIINGDLGVDFPTFEAHLRNVVGRSFPKRKVDRQAQARFVRSLHTNDLLLALACSRGSNAAWQRFSSLYRTYLANLSNRLIGRGFDPQDLSDTICIDLFLPDRSGQSRIASYDGRCSLATWLRVIVSNRIINERLRKDSRFSSLEGVPEPTDSTALHQLEAGLRLNRYGSMILRCFRSASLRLSPRDRLILLLRYDQELQLGEIARLFSVHQSTITRQIDRALAKLRDDLVASLRSAGLGPDATQECLSVAFESLSTSISIVAILKSIVKSERSQSAVPLIPGGTTGTGGA
jgi:RNA polymerase sigma-70 factor